MTTLTIQEAIKRTLIPLRVDNRANTARNYELGMRYFCDFLEAKDGIKPSDPTERINLDHIIEYAGWLSFKYKSSTAAVYFFGTKVLYDFLLENDLVARPDYYDGQRLIKVVIKMARTRSHKLPRVPTDDEINKVIEAQRNMNEPEPMKSRNTAIILFLYFSGVRNFELCRLKIGDLNLNDRTAFIANGKGGKDRVVHYTQEVVDAMQAYWKERGWSGRNDPVFARHDKGAGRVKHKPIGTQMIRVLVNAAETAAGLEGIVTPHKFRHHFATTLLAATGDLALVQDELGHASPETTRIYAQLTGKQRSDRYHDVFGE